MALSSVQQNSLFKLSVGLFNAAPGAFYNEVAGIVVSSLSEAAAADTLMNTAAYQAILPSKVLTNAQFASKFIDLLVGSTVTTANKAWAAAQIESRLNAGDSQGTVAWWAIDALSQVPTNDAAFGAAAATLLNKISVASYFTVDKYVASTDLATLQGLLIDVTSDAATVAVAKASVGATVISLSTTVGESLGTSGADLFQAWLAAGANTLQSGDTIKGGAGSDTLMADMSTQGTGENAIAFSTSSVEKVMVRSQHATTSNNNGDNNLGASKVAIDAERTVGVNTWENNNSRADLLIEDVRILSNQITKDITIVMRETDPGHVDYGVYFDQNSLRNVASSTSQVNLQVMDTRAVVDGNAPLLNSPYGGFRFTSTNNATGLASVVTLQSQAIDDAQTYAQLVAAFQAAADAQFGAGVVSATIGSNFTVTDTTTGSSVTGQEVVLSTSGAFTFTTPAGSGWIANGVVPANSGLHTNFSTGGATSVALVTSTIVLDDVGRGSTGGDLVVGGLSVGDTSTSKGVQRFEITVEDNSKLQTIASTNNTLREVTIVNGTTTRMNDAYTTTVTNAGNLTVNGTVGAETGINAALPGTEIDTNRDGDITDATDIDTHGAYGFSDIRLIDGSAMAGKLEFTAQITDRSIAKYLNLVDTANNPAADNVAFQYMGGSNDDTMNIVIDGAVIGATNSETGREDFSFTATGGAGNDKITLDTGDTETAAWVADQKTLRNVIIDGGSGNDTIKTPGAGQVIISAGTGDDTVYADNSGAIATVWAVNAGAAPVGTADLQADALITRFMFKGKLTVTISGAGGVGFGGAVTSPVAAALTNGFEVVVDVPTGNNYEVNQYYLNQAIKKAINGDAVLSKLLLAEDGPASTLTITSLIDGDFTADDLRMTVSSTDITTLTAGEQATALAAYKAWVHDSTAVVAAAQAANALAVTDLNLLNGMDAAQVLATDAGAISTVNDSDNIINLGAGTDVAVLGTGANSNDVLVFTGYDNGKETIVNFEDGTVTATAQDLLDFRAYLTGKNSLSGSTDSQLPIAVTFGADATAQANEVNVVAATFTTTDTFAGLTAAKLLTALNTTGNVAYAGIGDGNLGAQNTYITGAGALNLVGGIGHTVVMVENNLNRGEYAVFDLTFNGLATNTTGDFSAAQLIGVVDFGHVLGLTVADLVGF